MNTNEPPEIPPPLVLPHQAEAFARICAVARAVLNTNHSELPIKIRPSLFVTGPSGSGKSYLARAVAESMGLPLLSVSISEWVLISSTRRGAASTWPSICRFLASSAARDGCVIFTDELDKLRGHGGYRSGGEWSAFLLTELYSLYDLRVPELLADCDDDDDLLSEQVRAQAARVLRTKTLLIGAGAFQELWNRPDPQIGFGSTGQAEFEMPDLNTLARYVPRELINRMSSSLVILRPLEESDYHDMLATIAPKLPPHWRKRFETMARQRIPEAARLCQGPRFFEELLLDTIVAERMEVSAPIPPVERDVLDSDPGMV